MEINKRGLWWLPQKPDTKLSGQLIYQTGNDAILSLNGIFDEKIDFHDIVLGDVEGCKVTLVNCIQVSAKKIYSGTGDSSSSKFKIVAMCKGHHFFKKTDLEFTKISVRYSHLRKWLGGRISGTHIKESDPYLKQSIEKSLTVDILPKLSLEISGFLERENAFYYSPYNEETDVIFYLGNRKLSEVIETLDIFRNFLTICIDEKISIVAIEAQEEYGKVQLILPSILKPNNKEDISFIPTPVECNLFLKHTKQYLENWFLIAKKYEPMYQLFFSDNFERLYATTRFLNYSQAIEAYHVRKYENNFFPDNIRHIIDEFTNFSKTVKIVFPNQFSYAILQRFKYLNRKSLRMILKDLYKDYKPIFPIFIKSKSKFLDRFVNMRNYYTHYNPKAKKPRVEEIIVLTENARFILLSIFLKELGLDEQNLASAIYCYCRKRVREIKSL